MSDSSSGTDVTRTAATVGVIAALGTTASEGSDQALSRSPFFACTRT